MSTVGQEELESYLPPFGLSSFRPGQREVIETILGGRDCLCVMPTGGGKSLCYQLPAVARGGLTLVVSPLIALMKDQVDALTKRGLAATFINSTLSSDELSTRLARMAAGEYRLVYVVPERFRSNRFVNAVRRSDLRMLAIDEAHCISEWGHDFRKDYARLGYFRSVLGAPPTIALTATATPIVREDIVKLLALEDPAVFITGFSRPNLHYHVRACASDREKDEALFGFLDDTPGSGIVYASTRKRCEELGERIAARTGRPTTVYHAGLTADERRGAQDDFMLGRTQIAVATLAFGMGIDKPDVRFVVHYNLPGSLEAYYQEAGRAGRDGQRSDCLLLFGMGDRNIHQFFIESAYPSREVVAQVHRFLCGLNTNPIELTQQEVKEALNLQIGAEAIGTCEKLLESGGVLERLEAAENTAAVRLNSDLPTLVDLLPQQAKVKRQVLRAVEQWVGSQRNEWCYLQPRELLTRLPGYTLSDLGRHLRELTSLAAFDYVPPFRGRAIHVRDRTRRFDDLKIDFDALEARKNSEYEKLERVLRFARHRGCREQEILNYFGQHDSQACGRCDNCARSGPASRPAAASAATSAGLVDVVRMVLSGVARVSRSRSGCGKQLLAQMLCGSAAKGVTRNRLDKLSTFGLLAHARQTDVAQLIDALLVCGLLEQNELEPFRPVLALTDRGSEIMNGGRDSLPTLPIDEPIARRLIPPQQRATKAGKSAASPEPVSQRVPEPTPSRPSPASPANQTSVAHAVERPQGEAAVVEVATDRSLEQPTHYWTWRLLCAGFTPDECALIRALDSEVVLDHALRAADAGLPIQANWFLSEEQIRQIDAVIGSPGVARIRPLLERLPRGTRYEAVQLVLKSRGQACPA